MREYHIRRISFYISVFISVVVQIAGIYGEYFNLVNKSMSKTIVGYVLLYGGLMLILLYVLAYTQGKFENKCQINIGIVFFIILAGVSFAIVYFTFFDLELVIGTFKSVFSEPLPAQTGQQIQASLKCCGWDDIYKPAGGNACLHTETCHKAINDYMYMRLVLLSVCSIVSFIADFVAIGSLIYIRATIPVPKFTQPLAETEESFYN